MNQLKMNYHKSIYSQFVLNELNRNTLNKYREWNVIEYDFYNVVCNYFVDEEDEEAFYSVIEDELYYGDKPHTHEGIYKLTEDGTFHYTVKQYALFRNIISIGHNSNKCDSSMYSNEVRKDFLLMTLARTLNSNTHYDMRRSFYMLYPNEIKWFHVGSFKSTLRTGYPDNYRDMFRMREIMIKKYNKQVKTKLYRMICNEKLNLLNTKMLNRLNTDCWNLICDFVCDFNL